MAYTCLTKTEIDFLIASGPSYYAPLLISVRDFGLRLCSVGQNSRPIDLPEEGHPAVVLIGDDANKAVGPTGFHHASLRQLMKWADCAVLIACAPSPILYAGAAMLATWHGLKTLAIETRLAEEQAWIDCLTEANREIRLMIGTGTGGRA